MIYTPARLNGDKLELRRGDYLIRARVIWQDGARVGLEAEDRVPVDKIMTLGPSCVLQLTARAEQAGRGRASWRVAADTSRMQGRAIEFISIGMVAAALALSASAMVQSVLAKPLAAVSLALSPPAPAG